MRVERCTLIMAPDARIFVTKNVRLTSFVSVFRGCAEMWQGIEVQPLASVRFSAKSVIRDARKGIWLQPGYNMADCSMTNTDFIDNEIGLYVGGSNQSSFNFLFRLNEFKATTSTTMLLPPLSNQAPGTGIYFKNVRTAIIAANSGNKFSLTKVGIQVDKSSLDIRDGSFWSHREILDDSGIPVGDSPGHGLYSRESILSVKDCDFTSEPLGCIFSKNDKSLKVYTSVFTNFGITNAAFTKGYGIKADPMNSSAFLDIYDNDFLMTATEELYAIRVFRPKTLMPGSRIELNTITDSGDNPVLPSLVTSLISVESGLVANGPLLINTNIMTINVRGTVNGIVLNGNNAGSANNCRVIGNIITYTAPIDQNSGAPDAHGIQVKNVSGASNIISGNMVTAGLVASGPSCPFCSRSWAQCGIHLESSLNWIVCTNTVGGTVWNYHLVSSLGMMEFEANTSLGAESGLFGEKTSSFDQIRQANIFAQSTSYSAFAAYHSNQRFPIATSATTPNWQFIELSTDIPAKRAPANWFGIYTTGSFANVCVPEPPPPFTSDPERHTINDQNLIAGFSTFPNSVGAWDAKRQMLYRMLRYPELRLPNTSDEQYFLQNQSGTAWAFASAEKQVLDAFSPFTSSSATMNGYFSTLQSLTDQMIVLSAQHPSDSVYDATVLAAQNALEVQIQAVFSAIESQSDIDEANFLALLTAAETAVSNISTSASHEANRKTAVLFAIKKEKGIELTAAEFALLHAIAAQTEIVNGDAAQLSVLLLPESEKKQYDDEAKHECCSSHHALQEGNDRSKLTWPVASDQPVVSPNPADDQINLIIPQLMFGSKWNIVDTYGKIWQSGRFEGLAQHHAVSTNLLPSGSYFVEFVLPNGKHLTSRFSIAR